MSVYKGERVPFTFRVPIKLHKRLKELAKANGVPLNDYLVQVLAAISMISEDK